MRSYAADCRNARKIVRRGLLIAIAAATLSGCQGNNPISFPTVWNIQDSPVVDSAPENTATSLQSLSGLPGSAGWIGGLQRQPDCSLSYLNFSYSIQAATAMLAPNSQISHYETTLHESAALNTTADRFLSGCVDTNAGISSRPFLFLGPGKNGQELVAVPGISGVVTSGIKSDGTYSQPSTQITPVKSISLLSGDLNKDGNADLISINSNGTQSSVTVFLGNGDGTYQAGVDYPLPGANAQYGVLEDLNGDGIPDLLVSSESPAFAFSIFIGNGDGTFQPPQTFSPSSTNLHFNNAFITADVNGDGIKDIVSAQGNVFLGKGDGISFTRSGEPAFQPNYAPTNNFAPSILAADFNHDGKVDLATSDGTTICIYLGKGDGTFTAGPTYANIANSGQLLATDLDGDGNIDLWSGYGGNGIYSGDAFLPNAAYALMGNGDGTFVGTAGLPAAAIATLARPHATPDATSSLTITSPQPGTITVAAGQTSAPFTVVVSSPTDTAQVVTFACSGLPVLATCVFPPSAVNLTANDNSAQVSITIMTTASGNVVPSRRLPPPSKLIFLERLLVCGLMAASVLVLRINNRTPRWAISACLVLMTASLVVGCSSNSNSSSSGGTPAGTYAITISANGASGTPVSTPNTLTLKITQ